jgi:AraC-like DNA-binding protein
VDTQTVKAGVFLDGVNTVSRRLGFAGRVEQLGIRFHEGGAYPFLGIPLSEVRNEINLEGRVRDDNLLRLHARAYEESSQKKRINLLEDWLIERLSHGKKRSALIPASIRLLRENAGRLPIAELARELTISQRQLERLYQSEVGMTPKQYARLLRVENARQALKKIKHCTMTRLGANLGYYDQSHFIREFRSVIGITPYAYWKRSRLHSRTRKD